MSATGRQILIVEDHKMVLEGLKSLINAESDLAVCGSATCVSDANDLLRRTSPDLAIVDLSLFGDERIVEAIRTLLQGETYLSEGASTDESGLAKPQLVGIKEFSEREYEVFELGGRGISPSDIAKQLEWSVNSLRSSLERIKIKLGIDTMDELKLVAVTWQLDAAF